MPPNSSIPFRAALDVLRPVRPRPLCKCLNSQSLRYKGPSASTSRYVSTASPDLSEMEVDAQSSPRWSQTPPLMKAPVQSRLPKPDLTPLVCNSDPRKLDDMYTRFLGKGGDKLLSEEVKWLAVTAKSFDHGRRGFNDRLAFLGKSRGHVTRSTWMINRQQGKRIIELQCSLGLLSMSGDATHYLKEEQHDPLGREHFKHPATNAVEVIAGGSRKHYTHYKYLANVATQHGIPDVVRWHPRMVS